MDLSAAVRRLRPRPPVASVAAQVLGEIAAGQLARLPVSIRFWDGSTLPASTTPDGNGAVPPTIVVRRPRGLAHLLHVRGQLGFARAYIDGSVTLEGDLETVLNLRGQITTTGLQPGDRMRIVRAAVRAAGPIVLRPPPIPAIEVVPVGRRHSIGRDRQVVRHHYDLSNDFYRLILGPSMVYSCAYYEHATDTVDHAQERKLDLICRKLDLRPGERLLDIGCGWGSLVLHAASHYEVRATGVTLSEAQANLARQRAQQQGLSDLIEIRVADYRELSGGPFDKIASVGMYEHVGQEQRDRYVRTVARLLRPGGLMLNHAIARLDSEPPGKTFISRYIFPDGELHPVGELIGAMEANGLEVRDLESLHEHYGLTLRAWLANMRARPAEAEALVGAERVRSFELYLLGSAIAFEDDDITIQQVLATRMGVPHGLPMDRRELLEPRQSATAGTD